MAGALILLEVLVATSCVFVVFDGLLALSIVTLWTAAMLALIGLSIRSSEAAQAWRTIRIIGPFLLLFALLILAQCIPNSLWSHSVWSTAGAALNEALPGFISIDLGATLISLCRYLVFVAIAISALCIAVNRHRAESLILVLTAAGAISSLALIVLDISAVRLLGEANELDVRSSLQAISSLGVLLSVTLMIRSLEKFEIRRSMGPLGRSGEFMHGAVGVIGFAICMAAIALVQPDTTWLATFCGFLPVASVPIVRRFAHRSSEMRLSIALIVVIEIALIAGRMTQGAGDMTLRMAAPAGQAQISIAERMLGDANWLGNGAGTYAALAPLYRTISDPPHASVPPTTAAALAVGLGHAAVSLIVLMAIGLVVLLLGRALRRGQDSFYPALGAGCVVLVTINMFLNNSLLGTTVLIISGAIIGLSLGQSLGARHRAD